MPTTTLIKNTLHKFRTCISVLPRKRPSLKHRYEDSLNQRHDSRRVAPYLIQSGVKSKPYSSSAGNFWNGRVFRPQTTLWVWACCAAAMLCSHACYSIHHLRSVACEHRGSKRFTRSTEPSRIEAANACCHVIGCTLSWHTDAVFKVSTASTGSDAGHIVCCWR